MSMIYEVDNQTMRHIIQNIFLNCNVSENIKKEIATIDKEFKSKTIVLDVPIYYSYQEIFDDYENYWFYYRVPKIYSSEIFFNALISNLKE